LALALADLVGARELLDAELPRNRRFWMAGYPDRSLVLRAFLSLMAQMRASYPDETKLTFLTFD